MGLALVPIVMLSRSFNLTDIVAAQESVPFIVYQPLAFIIFLLSITAECKRIPFDLPEAEGELVAGFHTEYSGMRFGLFFVGEYINIIVLGDWRRRFFWGMARPAVPSDCLVLTEDSGCGILFHLDARNAAPTAL